MKLVGFLSLLFYFGLFSMIFHLLPFGFVVFQLLLFYVERV